MAMSKKKRLKTELGKSKLAARRQARIAATVERDAELREGLAHQLEGFREKFGRDPGPGDPLFFDPNKDEPSPMSGHETAAIAAELVEAMVKIGRPEFSYAYAKSGYLVSEENLDLIPDEGVRAWNGALKEWHEMSAVDRATAIQGLASRHRQ